MRRLVMVCLLLSSCATPIMTMKKGDSVVMCGGTTDKSMFSGAVTDFLVYPLHLSTDQDCMLSYAHQGYVVVKTDE